MFGFFVFCSFFDDEEPPRDMGQWDHPYGANPRCLYTPTDVSFEDWNKTTIKQNRRVLMEPQL